MSQSNRLNIIFLATIGGFIGALVSGILPSIPTQYWMWKERPEYRWVLMFSWVLVVIILFCVFYIIKKRKGG